MNKYFKRSGVLLAATMLSQVANATSVSAPAGNFIGKEFPEMVQYRGIPYAKAPVGELRWKTPQKIGYLENYQATEFGEKCAQPLSLFTTDKTQIVGDEDCLFLNLYKPKTDRTDLPVMVWIHGGGHITGFGDQFDTSALTANKNVITVTFNYRLGPLGYLSHPALGKESGNFGLLDQQMVMQWVKDNAEAFGGNPDNITLFGESAGGMSTGMHILTPSSKGLFNKAIIQSGPFFSQFNIASRAKADKHGETYVKHLGCDNLQGDELMSCLRDIPVEQAVLTSGLENKVSVASEWSPVYGTPIVPKGAREALQSGEFNQVPVINGSNLNEGNLFAHYMLLGGQLTSFDDVEKILSFQYGEKQAKRVQASYPSDEYKTPGAMYADIMTDIMFACPSYTTSKNLAKYVDVYTYEFSDKNAPIIHKPHPDLDGFGAYHASDIVYVLQTDFDLAAPESLNTMQKALSDQIQTYWANFAKNDTPNAEGNVSWKKGDKQNLNVLSLTPEKMNYTEDFAQRHRCDIWEPLL